MSVGQQNLFLFAVVQKAIKEGSVTKEFVKRIRNGRSNLDLDKDVKTINEAYKRSKSRLKHKGKH